MDNNRRLAFLALKEIEVNGKWVNLALSEQLGGNAAGLSGASGSSRVQQAVNHAFVRELVYTCVRNQTLLDYNIERFLKKPKLSASERILLRMGFCQLSLMDSVAEHAAVSETVALAAAFIKGRQGFINAILRSFQRDGKRLLDGGELYVRYSCAKWIIDLWTKAYGAEKAEELAKASNTPAPFVIRANTLKINRADLSKRLEEKGFKTEESKLSENCLFVSGKDVLGTEEFKDGLFSVQGEASAAAVELLSPKNGEIMLDLCAAPGGKSCYGAELMGDEGTVKAFDLYPHRAELIKASSKRLGLSSVFAEAKDSAVFDDALCESADCVLADVPCSGLGTLRRNPEIKLKSLAPNALEELNQIQYNILVNALKYARKGGRVLYSTCTVNPAENGQLVRRVLESMESAGSDGAANEKPCASRYSIISEQQLFQAEGGPDGFYTCLIART